MNSQLGRGRIRGFTLVELLVVTVVIAILASISVVAYQGITKRATNSAILADMNSWQKALMGYAIQTGAYPKADYTFNYIDMAAPAVCLANNNSGTNYCDLLAGSSTAGGYNDTTKDAIADAYKRVLSGAGYTTPTNAGTKYAVVLNNYSGVKVTIKGIEYKYNFNGPSSATDYGIFLIYPQFGRTCQGSDFEVDPTQKESYQAGANVYWSTTNTDVILCSRLLSKTLSS